jgi:hypothetical protein
MWMIIDYGVRSDDGRNDATTIIREAAALTAAS